MKLVPSLLSSRAADKYIARINDTIDEQRKMLPWDAIRSIVFLVDGSSPEKLRLLLNHLWQYQSNGKKVHVIGFTKKLPPFEDDGIFWFNNKLTDWKGIPAATVLKAATLKHPDILVNVANPGVRPLHYLAALTPSILRIAPYNASIKKYYDCLLSGSIGVEGFIQQMEQFLGTFNQPAHASV